MALQVWLPLNGNLKNQGVGTVTAVAEGVVNNSGKIGKCYACTSSNYVAVDYTIPTTSTFTISFWVKFPSTLKDSGSWQSLYSFAANDGSDKTLTSSWTDYNNIKIFDSTNHQCCWMGIDYDVWFQLTITNKFVNGTNILTVYRNGQLIGTYNKNIELKIRSGRLNIGHGILPAKGPIYFNDFRIYDECLTLSDAKDLYLGKVLDITPPWKRGNVTELCDASGFNTEITPVNITSLGKELVFNGNAYATLKPLTISGGTLSVWFKMAKPGNAWLYVDGTSHMGLTFYNSAAYIIPWISSVSAKRFTAAAVNWGQWNHIAITYNYSDCTPDECFVNGVSVAQSGNDYWTNGDSNAYLGRRGQSGSNMTGSLGEVKVFTNKLTATEIQAIYNKGVMENDWELESPTWLRVLHHNNPKAARFASQEDGKNKDTEDQFSKLKIFFNNDNFRRADGNYEFMVKEKLESGSTEQVYRWSQTSNPTASTVTGYKLISQTNDPGRSFGLKHNGSYAVFHNGSTWWCACGSWSVFNEGIPGFGGTVLTGYLDLYVRADKGGVPSEYIELEYIESTGASYFNTGEKFNCESDECKVIFKGNDLANNGMIFASNGAKYFWLYYYSTSGVRVYADNGNGQQGIAGIARDTEKHTMEWRGKHYYIDGSDKGTLSNTYTETTNNIWLFSYGGSGYPFKGRIYYAHIKRGGIYTRIFKPVKRRSDSVAGMYDVVTNTFYPSSATAFTAGPEI